ncbi:MAG: hypothetical protein KF752_18730 [Pirellulaceae bacterium]|nr:hypothetical protein [Pirellulaceae bacterium]
MNGSISFRCALSTLCFGSLLGGSTLAAGQREAVVFDVPAVVIAQPVNPQVVSAPTMGGRLLRLKIPVSTFISPEFAGAVSEYCIELDSTGQTMRVVDFWPKNETYSQYEGTVKVEASRHKDEQFNFSLAAAYPTVGQASARGEYRNQFEVQESYQRRPPMQTLTSSGTIRQGFGVMYKFRPGPVDVLEGAREIAVLVEVSPDWRADLLKVHMTAAGISGGASERPQLLGRSQLWITTYQEGDAEAAAQALAYVRQERSLRGLAASRQREIQQRSLPTIWHKVGAALEMVDSRIPADYLASVLFGPASPQFDRGTQRLPVDMRVAILDYWEARSQLMHLSQASAPSVKNAVAALDR